MFIKKLSTENFGPFDSGVFNFSPAVNVLVGPNATGKTYVLKVLYAFLRATARRGAGTKSSVQSLLTDFLVKTFRPLDGKLGKLARNVPGGSSARVRLEVEEPRASLEFGFGKKSKQVEIGEFSEYERVLGWAEEGEGLRPEVIYIPSNEVLTFASKNLRLIYEQEILRIEEPIIHLLELAKYGVQKGPKDREREELLSILKSYYEEEGSLLNPRVKGINYLEDTESFEVREEGVSVEAFLSSEGYRKLGLIIRLIDNRVLQRGAFLFWDEPEAHINPIVFEPLAKLIVSLAENLGVQIFVSSHSYLFVRWIDIFSENTARFFYFKRLEDTVRVEEGDRYLDVVPDELDEFLLSYERLMDASHGTTEG